MRGTGRARSEPYAPVDGTGTPEHVTPSEDARSSTGAWYTPEHLVDRLVGAALDGFRSPAGTVRIVDPACGDGRLLAAAAERLSRAGHRVKLVGCEIDPAAARSTRTRLGRSATVVEGNALEHPWEWSSFDLVVANPPFSSPLSSRGPDTASPPGSPYADLATRFWDLALELARPESGRVALILPQSILSSRDADNIRQRTESVYRLRWSWWSELPTFEAQVTVCSVVFERSRRPGKIDWTGIVTDRLNLPPIPSRLSTKGTIAERARVRANFRDEYYGL
ncbi:MAG: SAM-dependent DNA methyltransferase, partial [Acidimicrobiia bacterium]|nr:SAM-dependent DNA methyltransferase [Acidimicrobiia bacterium]